MHRFNEWQREEIEELLLDYPNLFNMSHEEIEKIAEELFWTAQSYIGKASSLEQKYDAIQIYLNVIEKE